jgi:hypothetical protein
MSSYTRVIEDSMKGTIPSVESVMKEPYHKESYYERGETQPLPRSTGIEIEVDA